MVLAKRKIAMHNIKKSSLKNHNCVIELDENFKNTKDIMSLSENKQTRWKYNQIQSPKSLSYHFSFDKKYQKSEKKKTVLKNKPALYDQKALTQKVIFPSSIHPRSGDGVVMKSEKKKSVSENKQSNTQTAPRNTLTHSELVDIAPKKSQYKTIVLENKQSRLLQKHITKSISYSDSIHELGKKVEQSSNEKCVPKKKPSLWMSTQNARPKMCYFSSSHKLNKKVENLKSKKSSSESKQSVWRYKQTAPPNTVSYFTYLVV